MARAQTGPGRVPQPRQQPGPPAPELAPELALELAPELTPELEVRGAVAQQQELEGLLGAST